MLMLIGMVFMPKEPGLMTVLILMKMVLNLKEILLL
jgi:hypothetical protein